MKRRGFIGGLLAAGATLCLPRIPASKALLTDGTKVSHVVWHVAKPPVSGLVGALVLQATLLIEYVGGAGVMKWEEK